MTALLIALTVFIAIFVQSFSGFGLALVMMPLLSSMIGVHVAAPLVALIALLAEAIILLRYREALNLQAVKRITLASLVGIPFGILAVRYVDESIVLPVLGIVVAGYALYALSNLRLPEIRHPGWAYGLGFVAGVFGAAYNTSGPPVIIYGTCRRWPPAEFKSNLQGFFLVNSIMVAAAHGLGGNFTPTVLQDVLIALPAIALGALAGFSLDGRINPAQFRRIVLVLLVVLGGTLIV